MWRSQIYSSNLKFSLQGLTPNEVTGSKGGPPPVQSFNAGGDWKAQSCHAPSLVIIHRNAKIGGTEYYVPPRLLQGIVPSVFLETFHIWQGEDGLLRGEPRVSSQWFNYRIEIAFEFASAGLVTASVTRHSLLAEVTEVKKDPDAMDVISDQTGLRRSMHNKPRGKEEPSQEHDANLEKLLKSGFTRQDSLLALQHSENDYEGAVSYLLDSSTKDERKEDKKTAEGAEAMYSTVASAQAEDTDSLVATIAEENGISAQVLIESFH